MEHKLQHKKPHEIRNYLAGIVLKRASKITQQDLEDLLQDAYTVFYDHMQQGRVDHDRQNKYLVGITWNLIKDYYRTSRKQFLHDAEYTNNDPTTDDGPSYEVNVPLSYNDGEFLYDLQAYQKNTKQRIAWSRKYVNRSYSVNSSYRIKQLTKEGEYITTWDSYYQINKALGFNQGNIHRAVHKGDNAYGYKWAKSQHENQLEIKFTNN